MSMSAEDIATMHRAMHKVVSTAEDPRPDDEVSINLTKRECAQLKIALVTLRNLTRAIKENTP